MVKINTLLNERLNKAKDSSKMRAMAQQSANGNLTSFSGIFSVAELKEHEKEGIAALLKNYAIDTSDISTDLSQLLSITSEVKAINNQAAILHGERIKKAHTLLVRYRDGAFTAWLMMAYGNRQTPYNLMQYYEFYEAMPQALRPQIEAMPRQAIYTLASREGPIEKKRTLVECYQGETKAELLSKIREAFPLDLKDKRRENVGHQALQVLQRLYRDLTKKAFSIGKEQKKALKNVLFEIQELIENL